MVWPGAAGGAVAGAAAGAPFGPIGVGVGAAGGALLGGYAGYQNGGKGSAKFNAKRGKKAMQAAARQDIRSQKRYLEKVEPLAGKARKKAANQQMDIEEKWIKRQQKIHPKALEKQRKYQNKTAKKQIPKNAKLRRRENEEGFHTARQEQEFGQYLHKGGRAFRNENAAENRELFENYGMPLKYEKEKFTKKSLLTPEQKRNLAFQNEQGLNQKEYRDIAKNPLFKQAKGVIGKQLREYSNPTAESRARADRPYLENFERNVLPNIQKEASSLTPGQRGSHLAQAEISGRVNYQNQRDMQYDQLRNSILDRALQYAGHYSGQETASRQQEIQNAMNQAQMGLTTKGFERYHNPALYVTPQGGNISGGGTPNFASSQPSFAGVGQAQYSGLNVPNINLGGGGGNNAQYFNQQQGNGNPGLNAFLGGAGQGAGAGFANLAQQGIQDFASRGGSNAPQDWSGTKWGAKPGGFG